MPKRNLDKYGGWTTRQYRRTGFFHLSQTDGRWWFVDPDGHPFISLGINHIKAETLKELYNREVFERKYGTNTKFYESVFRDLTEWGFNTLGNYNDQELPLSLPFIHVFRFLNVSGYYASWKFREEYAPLPYEYFPDVFSGSWRRSCEEKVADACDRFRENPLLLGYFYSDVPVWSQADRWTDATLAMSGPTPGKEVYLRTLRERYGESIGEFNAVYGTSYRGWEAILEIPFNRLAVNNRSQVTGDDEAFLRRIAKEYYGYVHDLIREYDPNHSLLGDRYDGNAGIPDFVLEEARGHTDALSLQYYQLDSFDTHLARIDHWQGLVGKPVIDTDSSYSVPKPKMPDPYGPHVADQRERGLRYKDYAQAFFSRPYGVGWHWCGYIDARKGSGAPGKQLVHQHSGLKDEFDEPHQEALEIIKSTNARIYEIAVSGISSRASQ
jgi:hypothetical protein